MKNEIMREAMNAITKAIAFHPYSPQQTELLIEQALRMVYAEGRNRGINEATEIVKNYGTPATT